MRAVDAIRVVEAVLGALGAAVAALLAYWSQVKWTRLPWRGRPRLRRWESILTARPPDR